jgi:hypothetical protein
MLIGHIPISLVAHMDKESVDARQADLQAFYESKNKI